MLNILANIIATIGGILFILCIWAAVQSIRTDKKKRKMLGEIQACFHYGGLKVWKKEEDILLLKTMIMRDQFPKPECFDFYLDVDGKEVAVMDLNKSHLGVIN